jgi:hypothetical protein
MNMSTPRDANQPYVLLLNQVQMPIVAGIVERERWYLGELLNRFVLEEEVFDRVYSILLEMGSNLRQWAEQAVEKMWRNESWHAGKLRGHPDAHHDKYVLKRVKAIILSTPGELRAWAEIYLQDQSICNKQYA